ncbi:helix-turn-helix domain-containing protein [Paenibacillus thailandensis]|uniref:Helix-turn-helix domain-containing protein n=1 Tax=Paenibacillus thailandensis TaxID=393250 RepID=A0ABW5QYA6_9BACL
MKPERLSQALAGTLAILSMISLFYLLSVHALVKAIKDEMIRSHRIELDHTAALIRFSRGEPDNLPSLLKDASEALVLPDKLVVTGADGHELFRSEEAASLSVPPLNGGRTYLFREGYHYLFADAGEGIGLVSAVEHAEVRQAYRPYAMTALALPAAALAVFLAAAAWYARRMIRPVRDMLAVAAGNAGTGMPNRRIGLNEARDAVNGLIQERELLIRGAAEHRAALATLDYMNRLRNLNPDMKESGSIPDADSYLLIVLDFRRRNAGYSEWEADPGHPFVSDMIAAVRRFAETHARDAHAFQIDPMQLVAVLPEADRELVIAALREQLPRWRQSPFAGLELTAVVSERIERRTLLTEAYRQACQIAERNAEQGGFELIEAHSDEESDSGNDDGKRRVPPAVPVTGAGADEMDSLAAFVLDMIRKRYDQDLSLHYLSDLLNMSNTYLSTYIKEKTGKTFSDHLHDVRVRKAQELLVTTNQTIHDIASQVGYVNFSSFNRMFKKHTGLTPGEYRKRQIIRIHKSG